MTETEEQVRSWYRDYAAIGARPQPGPPPNELTVGTSDAVVIGPGPIIEDDTRCPSCLAWGGLHHGGCETLRPVPAPVPTDVEPLRRGAHAIFAHRARPPGVVGGRRGLGLHADHLATRPQPLRHDAGAGGPAAAADGDDDHVDLGLVGEDL